MGAKIVISGGYGCVFVRCARMVERCFWLGWLSKRCGRSVPEHALICEGFIYLGVRHGVVTK